MTFPVGARVESLQDTPRLGRAWQGLRGHVLPRRQSAEYVWIQLDVALVVNQLDAPRRDWCYPKDSLRLCRCRRREIR